MIVLCILYLYENDLFSGILHFTLDNPNHINHALVGHAARAFQEHHDNPRLITQDVIFSLKMALPLVMVGIINWILGCAFWNVFIMIILGNLVIIGHACAHGLWNNNLSFLQGILFIPVKRHLNHHKPPHNIDFCVFNGWANPLVNKMVKVEWIKRYDLQIFLIYMLARVWLMNTLYIMLT